MSTYRDAIAVGEQGRYAEAEAMLRAGLDADPNDTNARVALDRTLLLLGRAPRPVGVEANFALAHTLANLVGPAALQGADEGARLQQAAEIIQDIRAELPASARPAAARILQRVGDYAGARALGDLAELGRYSALNGQPGALLYQLAKVETDADRLELLHQHRLWAGQLEAAPARQPIIRPPRAERAGLRLGFLSSDLRHHVVGFFAQPLFQHRDPRFELFAYSSFPGRPDVVEQWFVEHSTGFRRLPADDRAAAELIAADDLDMLIDLSGPTAHGRPGVLAYRPAPLQAAWLGYAHSLGLSAIDYFIADADYAPRRADLLLEAPLLLPDSFLCISQAAFRPEPGIDPTPPAVRSGMVTFGTANDPYKFNPRLLRTWAEIVAAVPNSRLMFIRPEAGAPAFRENISRYFAERGVSADRLDFRAVRGGVRPHYADMDIALDTFPVTGGTTTCEALWMGVPTVTLVGEGPYERLSWSILNNLGLGDLGAWTVEEYVRVAVGLARAPDRLAELRATMRYRIMGQPIGQPAMFAAGFYTVMADAIAARRR